MKNNKMLFFRTQADEADVDGIDDQLCIPASRLVSISPGSVTTIEMLFNSVKNNALMHNEQLTYDKVTLTVTQGDIQEVMDALVQKINSYPHSNGFLVIADDCATTDSATAALANLTIPTAYAHPSISGIVSITVAAKLFRTQLPSIGTGNAAMTAGSDSLALSVNTHYKSIAGDMDVTIPSAVAGKAGDWITVTYVANVNNGVTHTYTSTTDTAFAPGSIIRVQPHDATRIGVVDEATTSDNILTITGLTNGDGGIGSVIRMVNMTGTTNGWAVDAFIEGQGACSAASAATVWS